MPDGKPYKGNDGKYAPTALLAEIGQYAAINDKGEVYWQNFTFQRFALAIRSVIVILDPEGGELTEMDSWHIVWPAMKAILLRQGGHKPLSPADVIKDANREAAKYFHKSPTEYVLVTSLSVAQLPSSRIVVRTCKLLPLAMRGNRFDYPQALKRQIVGTPFAQHLAATKYQLVKVTTAGRSHIESVAKALDSLALLRGLWTLFATYGSWSITGGMAKYKSLGVIHAGPIQTLHNIDGTLVGDVWWYDSEYAGDQAVFAPQGGWKQIEKDRRWAMRRLTSLPYKSDLEDLIVRYAIALDQTNLDVTFLEMWGLLEKMTDTVGGNYDETIRRTIRIYKDRHIAKGLLETLRCRRNQFVHAARSAEERDQIAYLVKSFVDPHLLCLIRNDFQVQSLREYGEWLSLPADTAILKQQQRHLKQALRMAQKWD
jgi:hypothetical protein